MTIDEALTLIENKYVKADIEAMTAKDRLNFWINLKEFQVPKIQRATFEPVADKDIEIEITWPHEELESED